MQVQVGLIGFRTTMVSRISIFMDKYVTVSLQQLVRRKNVCKSYLSTIWIVFLTWTELIYSFIANAFPNALPYWETKGKEKSEGQTNGRKNRVTLVVCNKINKHSNCNGRKTKTT